MPCHAAFAAVLVLAAAACQHAAAPAVAPVPGSLPATPRLALISVYDPTPPVGAAGHAEIRLRDARTGELIRTISDPCQTYGRAVFASPSGDALYEQCGDAQEITRVPLSGGAPVVIGRSDSRGMILSGDGTFVWAFVR